MAKKVGICKNIDCENYNKPVEVASGSEFECPVCHQPLKESKGNGGSGKSSSPSKLPFIAGGVLVLALAGAGAYFGLSGDDKSEPVKVETPAETPVVEEKTVQPDSVQKEEPKEEPKEVKEEPVKVMNGRGTVALPYGSYTGELKNGKPHGYGKITYTTTHKIVPSKDFVASPGDTFEGEFRDGKISGIGYWEHNGNKTAIKL